MLILSALIPVELLHLKYSVNNKNYFTGRPGVTLLLLL